MPSPTPLNKLGRRRLDPSVPIPYHSPTRRATREEDAR